ncbi:MAG: sulfatase-like hydrolase/transferase [Acidimicrobiia bacterium]|nr:sulfatase-like hydrolase/transferase [Acidimicrobiia bacterium]
MDRRRFLQIGAGAAGALMLPLDASAATIGAGAGGSLRIADKTFDRNPYRKGAPNLLFISIDDLNDWVGYLGHPVAKTPKLDAFAATAGVFERAYCSVAMCGPSRTSVLTGISPLITGLLGWHDAYYPGRSECAENNICIYDVVSANMTLFDFLYLQGYDTFQAGKVYHDHFSRPFVDENGQPPYQEHNDLASSDPGYVKVGELEWSIVDDPNITTLPDHQTVDWCVAKLGELTNPANQRPWAMACGITQPHTVWRIPRQFWDRYDRDEVKSLVTSPVSANWDLLDVPMFPKRRLINANHEYMNSGASIRTHTAYNLWGAEKTAEAIHAYLAAISYADAQFGRIIAALENTRFRNNTKIVVWSDHGWHLGDKLAWHKMTLWEQGTRVPFLIKDPGNPSLLNGERFRHPVSLLDLFPTIMAMLDLPIMTHLSGRPLQDQLAAARNGNLKPTRDNPPLMYWEPGNMAVRQGDWRYILYRFGGQELYNLYWDPEEQWNRAHPDQTNPYREAKRKEMLALLPRRQMQKWVDLDVPVD